ncbi:MAG: tetratricopeptide repeat protein [Thermoplasmata archaeon]
MKEEEVGKLIRDPSTRLIIIHGPSDSGKTFTVKNALSGMNYIYMDEKDYSINGILKKFQLINDYARYMNIMKTISPTGVSDKEIFVTMVMKKINSMRDEVPILVLDRAGRMGEDILQFVPEFVSRLMETKLKLIIIYSDDDLSPNARYVFQLFRGEGVKEMIFNRPDYRELRDIISNLGYLIPEGVFAIIYSRTGGYISRTLEALRILEMKKFIVDGLFMKPPTEETLREVLSLLYSGKSPLQELGEKEKKVLLYISLAENGIDAFDLISILDMREDDAINILDMLIKLKYVDEDGNNVRLSRVEMAGEIESMFSSLYINSARIKMAEYMKSKGRKEEAGKLYFLAGRLDDAYEYLRNLGFEYYEEGELGKASELLEYTLRIRYDEDVAYKILDILTLLGDYEKMIGIAERLLMEHPDRPYYKIKYAEALYNTGKYREAELIFRDLLNEAKNDNDILYDYIALSRVLIARERFTEAREFLEKSLELSRKINDTRNEALALRLLGNIEFYMDKIEKALEMYKKSLSLIENMQLMEDIASLYNNIANIIVEENPAEAREYYRKAFEIAQEHWYVNLLQTLYHNLSIIEYNDGNINKAIDMEKRTLGISIASGRYDLALLAITTMMDPLFKRGEIEEQRRLTQLAMDIASRIGNEFMENFFRGYSRVLNVLEGKEDEFGDEVKVLENATPMYRDYVYYLYSAMEMWRGNINRANEIQKESIERRLNNITTDLIIDMTDLVEFLLYENFFYGNRENEIKRFMGIIEGYKNLGFMRYVQCRLNISKSIVNFDDNSIKIFSENVSFLERENLRYLVGKVKTIFGLYYARRTGDRKILDEGLKILRELNMPGILKGYQLAFSFNL